MGLFRKIHQNRKAKITFIVAVIIVAALIAVSVAVGGTLDLWRGLTPTTATTTTAKTTTTTATTTTTTTTATQSAITVTSYSINPSIVLESPAAATDLSIGLKNGDKNRSHEVRLVFITNQYVTLSMGEGRLSRSNSTWAPYEFIMAPGQERTEHITVRAKLEPGQTSATYSILVEFYVDGKQIETKTQDLTVVKF